MKKFLITFALLAFPCFGQKQVTYYGNVGFAKGATSEIPGNCTPPSFYWNTTNSTLYTCVATPENAPGTFTVVGFASTATTASTVTSLGSHASTELTDTTGLVRGAASLTSAGEVVVVGGTAGTTAQIGTKLAHVAFIGPLTGTATPTWRVLAASDLPDQMPLCTKSTVTYADPAFKVAAKTTIVPLENMSQYKKFAGGTTKHSVIFSDGAGAMTEVGVSVGDSSSATAYIGSTNVGEATAVSATAFLDGTDAHKSTTMDVAGRMINAYFTAVDTNFGILGVSITAGSNAAAAELTSAAHGLINNNSVTISGFTGNWAAANGTWTITKTGDDTFTIPLNSTAFGAIAGTPVYDATYLVSGSVDFWLCKQAIQ